MKLIAALFLITFFAMSSVLAQVSERKLISINNKNMAYRTFGLENRKIGEPIVVFESGLGSSGGSNGSLFPFIQGSFAGIVYDRNGIGESELDSAVKTDADVVKRLHDLLTTLKISPPYLLVGHSIGGPFIRLFASKHPEEIAGLFFIDPTDFMLTKEEDDEVKFKTGSKTGYQELLSINLQNIIKDPSTSTGFRHEAERELNESTPHFFKNYTSLPPLPDIPVTVMIAYSKHIEQYETKMNEELNLGINLIPWWKELDQLRIEHYAEMIKNNRNSKLILLPKYSHGIHQQDPKLVAEALISIYNSILRSSKPSN